MRCSSDEGPALHDLDDEVLACGERLVAVRGAALRAAQVQVAVQPDAELPAITTTLHYIIILTRCFVTISERHIVRIPTSCRKWIKRSDYALFEVG